MGNSSSTAMSTREEVSSITLRRISPTDRKASTTRLPAEVQSIVIRYLIGNGPVISNDPSYNGQYVAIRSLLLASKAARRETLLHLQDKRWSFVITDFPTCKWADRDEHEIRSIFRKKLAPFPPCVWRHLVIRYDFSVATKVNALSAECHVQRSLWSASQSYKHAREAAKEGSLVIAQHSKALSEVVWSILLREQRLRPTTEEGPLSGMSWPLLHVNEFRRAQVSLPSSPVKIDLLFDREDSAQSQLSMPLWLFQMMHEILEPWRRYSVESGAISIIQPPSRMATAAMLDVGFRYFRTASPPDLAKMQKENFEYIWQMSAPVKDWPSYLPTIYSWAAEEIQGEYNSIPWYYDAKFVNCAEASWSKGIQKVFIISTTEGNEQDRLGGLWDGKFVMAADENS
jgi:hypothetical protein